MTKKKSALEELIEDKTLIISVIALLVIFSIFTIGIVLKKDPIDNSPTVGIIVDENIVRYGDFEFKKAEVGWTTNLAITDSFEGPNKMYEIAVHYTPAEVEDIPTIRNSDNDTISPNLFLNARLIYVTTDPAYPADVVLGGVEVAKIMGKIYGKEVKGAVTREDERTAAPVITCDDTSGTERIIELRLGNTTEVFREGACVVIQGTNSTEILRASTRVTFELLKIL